MDYRFAGLYLNLQYLQGRFPLGLADTGSGTEGRILFGLEQELFSNRLLLRLGGLAGLETGTAALLPLLRWRPSDGLELDLGGLVSQGDGDSPLAGRREFFLGARYRF